jgi:hypothetical protein
LIAAFSAVLVSPEAAPASVAISATTGLSATDFQFL